VELNAGNGEKFGLIKPAAESLNRVMASIRKVEPELLDSLSFVPVKCAVYDGNSKSFNVRSWQVSVTLGGRNSVPFLWTLPFIRQEPTQIEPLLVRLESIAKFFREERWYWGGC
jgi:hypothetical protein